MLLECLVHLRYCVFQSSLHDLITGDKLIVKVVHKVTQTVELVLVLVGANELRDLDLFEQVSPDLVQILGVFLVKLQLCDIDSPLKFIELALHGLVNVLDSKREFELVRNSG